MFFDIDKTIFFRGRFPLRISLAIKRAQKAGHYVVLNTGRSRAGLPKSVLRRIRWDGLICAGAYTEFNGEVLASELMPRASVEKIVEHVRKENIPAVFDCVGPSYFWKCKGPLQLKNPEDIFIDFDNKKVNKVEVLRPLRQEILDELEPYAACYSMGTYVDIFVHGCSKATGMELIGKKTGIPRERMIAFGDNNNDIDMLKYAGKSVVMERGSAGAKAVATFRATGKKLGVVQGIKEYLGV